MLIVAEILAVPVEQLGHADQLLLHVHDQRLVALGQEPTITARIRIRMK